MSPATIWPAYTAHWCGCGLHGHAGHRDVAHVGSHHIVELDDYQMQRAVRTLCTMFGAAR